MTRITKISDIEVDTHEPTLLQWKKISNKHRHLVKHAQESRNWLSYRINLRRSEEKVSSQQEDSSRSIHGIRSSSSQSIGSRLFGSIINSCGEASVHPFCHVTWL